MSDMSMLTMLIISMVVGIGIWVAIITTYLKYKKSK